ncbi:hypothetical protein [Luteipulveratus mongoliensis]|uniref:Uncharacterized protein n=1 Tax=Luteipulveratus mongoliensis TaxID=571913 RepID=A0A0K1JF99_9MICO|nr:hypothetical protein [Luteipulveratus mongoliensis]AKU15253.1 hypothetical protein VV02_04225 [Luteipulveratus mongoliensis]
MIQFNQQQYDAEVAYRRDRIARDYRIAHDWESAARRAGGRVKALWSRESKLPKAVRRAPAH